MGVRALRWDWGAGRRGREGGGRRASGRPRYKRGKFCAKGKGAGRRTLVRRPQRWGGAPEERVATEEAPGKAVSVTSVSRGVLGRVPVPEDFCTQP